MAEDRMLSDEILLGIINSKSGGGGGGTGNYNDLSNQPQINNNTLIGNKTASDLGLVAAETGKGLSSNDYTDADKAIVDGVTAALAGKQGVLTAGKYIDIDANNEISVNRDLVPHQTSYRIKGTGRDTMNITKYIDGVQESSTDYVYSQGTTRTIDDAFTINDTYSSAGYIWQFVWLKDSTTHDKDYTVEYRSYEGAFDFTEVFNDEDLSGYKLVIKSEMDAALALKQDKTDNNLDTEAKTIVGAINEHEGDIDSLKSGLTNYEAITNAALSVPEDSGKNLFSGSFTTTTNGGVTFTANSDGTVSATNTSTGYASVNSTEFTLKKGQYIFSGAPSGNAKYVLVLYANNVVLSQIANGSNVTINLDSDTALVMRCVINGADVETGVDFEPMIRPSFITDPTFAPYIPSVDTRLDSLEKGNVSHEILKSSTGVWSGDTLTFTVAPENNRMWRLVAGVSYALGTKFVEAYIVIRAGDSGAFVYNAHGTVTATYDYTTGVLTVTLPESSHWIYRMELAAAYYD